MQYSTTHRNNCMSDIVTAAGAAAYVLIYSGTPPANCGAAATGTLLASLPCSATLGTVSNGVLTFNAVTPEYPGAAGTAGYWRLCTSAAGTTVVAQGTCGTSGADMNMSTTALTTGTQVNITGWSITAFGA